MEHRKSHRQIRVSWRRPAWPANKVPAFRIFRSEALARDFVAELRAPHSEGLASVVVEEREVSSSQWRPCAWGGDR